MPEEGEENDENGRSELMERAERNRNDGEESRDAEYELKDREVGKRCREAPDFASGNFPEKKRDPNAVRGKEHDPTEAPMDPLNGRWIFKGVRPHRGEGPQIRRRKTPRHEGERIKREAGLQAGDERAVNDLEREKRDEDFKLRA